MCEKGWCTDPLAIADGLQVFDMERLARVEAERDGFWSSGRGGMSYPGGLVSEPGESRL